MPSNRGDLQERLRVAKECIEAGSSHREVSRLTGLAMSTLGRHFPGTGWSRDKCSYVHGSDLDATRAMLLQGLSGTEIARELRVHPRTVSRWRAKIGMPGKKTNYSPSVSKDELGRKLELARYMIRDGAAHNEIARTLGMHTRTLRRHFPGTGWSRVEIDDYSRMKRLEKKMLANIHVS